MSADYRFPYPSPEMEAEYPFRPLTFGRRSPAEMAARAADFYAEADARRSVRMFSDEPVPRHLIETAIVTASTAPSGAHCQPWTFVATSSPALKRAIRGAAEEEEQANYVGGRMNEEWQAALKPIGTDWHKEFLEHAPWIVVVFEQRYGINDDGSRRHHYYVKESVGIACGLFIAALHHMGLATLTHTPTPMAFLTRLFERPANERPFVMFPIGFPLDGVKVPDLRRRSLEEIAVFVDEASVLASVYSRAP